MIYAFLEVIVILVVLVLIVLLVQGVINLYRKLFKKNCFKCKHWYLANVASFGDGCDYRCKKTGRCTPHMISFNCHEWWVKCKEYEKED